MADERRPRGERRVGDATKARIDDMATGWKKPDGSPDVESEAAAPPRPEPPRSAPPPAPKAPQEKKGSTSPPPLPKARASAASSQSPPRPPVARVATPTMESGPAHARTIRRSTVAKPAVPRPAASRPGVSGPATPEPASNPILSSAASGGAARAEATGEIRAEGSPLPVRRRPITSPPPKAVDQTIVPDGDEPSLELRAPASLPRQPGLWGDMRYVGTVIAGRRRLRLDLKETGLEIEAEKRSRDKELTEFARLAISDPNVQDRVVERARDHLVELEEVRSRKAGAAAAAEQAIEGILRERDQVKEERGKKVVELEAQVSAIEAKLAPLEKRRVEIGKRAREAVDSLKRYDERIAEQEELIRGASAVEAASGEATLAGLKAEREVADRRGPLLASELAEVEPVIRDLKAEKGELAKQASKLKRAEDESVVRSEEKVTAARAHKLVVDRAAADRTREQNEVLRDLGEALYGAPPEAVAHLAGPIEDRARTLEHLKTRATIAREKLESVQRWPLVRGIGLWALVLAALVGLALAVLKFV